MNWFLLLGVVLLVNYVKCAEVRVDPLVLIGQGLVRGQKATDGDYSTFFGIPYAQVDGANPFGDALSAPKFEEDIYNAKADNIKCPQNNENDESLDCLRLNIYVPNQASSNNPLPVLVWVHGGLFSSGSSGEFGARKLAEQGIIIVTINYRLGPYGFMCLDVPSVTGNQGLKDQFMALQWIRNNIGAFGGNPYNVTLAGQDAGAASVLLHLYSNKEKLYNKIIVQSGTPLSDGLFVEGNDKSAIQLAEYLGFNTTDTTQALQFLSTAHHTLVIGATDALSLELKPCKEKSFSGVENFIDSDPFTMSNEKKVKNTPVLIGHNEKEYLITSDTENDIIREKLEDNFNLSTEDFEVVYSILKHFYLGDDTSMKNAKTSSELQDFYSDFVINYPIQNYITSLLADNASPVYEYVFNYPPEDNQHSLELQYLFDYQNQDLTDAQDVLMSNRMVLLWSNFVKHGNPTPATSELLPVMWEPVSIDTRPYLHIDTELEILDRVYKERMAFWDLFYVIYGKYSKLARTCTI